MKVNERKRVCVEWFAAACVAFFALYVLWKTSGCFFETNDDGFVAEVLSGSLGGVPNPHIVLINYFLTYPLSLLYKITFRIPWYGLMFLVFQLLTYTAMLQSVFSRREETAKWIPAAGILVSCFLLNLYIAVLIEFTSTSALMACGAFVCLLLNRKEKSGWILFCILNGMAFLLRSEAMLMIQPLGMLVCVSEFWRETQEKSGRRERERIPEWVRKTGCMILCVGGIVLAGSLGTVIGFLGETREDWEDYYRYNQARVELFDYTGTPSYDEVKDILDRYGVSAAGYQAFQGFTLLVPRLDTGCIEELARYSKSRQTTGIQVAEIAAKSLKMRKGAIFYRMDRVLLVICVGMIVWMILRKHWTMALSMALLAFGSAAVEGYLIYRGRLPQRVLLPLYFAEIIFMAVIWVRDYWLREETGEGKKLRMTVMCLCALAVAVFCFSSGKLQHDSTQVQRQWQDLFEERMVVIYGYSRANPENRYLMDIAAVSNYRTDVLETRLAGWQNCVYTGSWFFHNPVYNDFLRGYLEGEEEHIRLIVEENEYGEAWPPVAYLSEALGQAPVVVDRISIPESGEEYLVWAFGGE